jgi:vacuolar-type H+-ATPase catalytic subunit A/Vma1
MICSDGLDRRGITQSFCVFDDEHRGNLDLLCSTLGARVEKHDLNWHEYPAVKAFATASDEELSEFTLTDIYGCNFRVAACLDTAGIKNGEQLYQKYRDMGHHFDGMRDWLRAQIPAKFLEDEEGMGNLEQICCTLEARVKRHNARGDTPPEAPPQ